MDSIAFVFAHQDDEFAVFPVIERLARSGKRIRCCYLTDGAFGGQPAGRREAESLAALAAVGVATSSVDFAGPRLGIADSMLHKSLDAAADYLATALRAFGDIEALFIPAWEGGHQDHDAAHAIGSVTASRLGLLNRTWQFSLYNGAGLPGPFFRVLHPLPGNGAVVAEKIPWQSRFRYLWLCCHYSSQRKTWLGLFPFVLAAYLFHGYQELQRVDLRRLFSSPHPGRQLYERRGYLTQHELSDQVHAFLQRNGVAHG